MPYSTHESIEPTPASQVRPQVRAISRERSCCGMLIVGIAAGTDGLMGLACFAGTAHCGKEGFAGALLDARG
jgi:hypothetical protein